ncbi:putative ribonuclease H-like domain-containing protein [Tanacetum coccineum]
MHGILETRMGAELDEKEDLRQCLDSDTASEIENQPLYDRFVTAEGMHAVPPPMTVSKSRCQKSLNVESQPKVWSDAPIIEEYESDSEDECVVIPTKQKVTPSFAKQQVKTPRENVKKEMARKAELNNGWNNVQRVNKQNQFVPSAVLTRTGIIPVNTARTSGKLLLIPHQVVIGDHKDTMVDPNTMVDPVLEIDYPHRALKNKGIVDSGCSRHMTGNKAYLAEFQDFNGGPVAFGGIEGFNIIDEGFLVGYSLQSKAFRVYNLETKRVEENLHINFLENKPNIAGKGPTWLFDLDYLTDSMNYHPVRSENQANHLAGQQEANQNAGTEDIIDAGDSETEDESAQDCFVLPIWPSYSSTITPDLKTDEKRDGPREEEQVFMDELERLKRQEKEANEEAESLRKKFETLVIQEGAARPSSTNIFSTVSTPAKASSTNLVNTVSIPVSTASPHEGLSLSDPTNPEEDDSEIPPLEDIYQNSTDGIFTTSSYDDEGAVADFTNLETVVNVSPIPTSRIHSTHPKALILGDPNSAVQTRSKLHKSSGAHAFVSYVQKQRRNNHKDFQHCLFACFLSQHEPKKISEALEDESLVLNAMQERFVAGLRDQKVWVLEDLPYGKKAIGAKWVYRNKKDERGVVVRNKASAFLYGKIDEELPEPGMQLLSTFLLKNSYRRDAISQDRKLNDVVITISIGHSKVSHLSASREFLSDYAGANLVEIVSKEAKKKSKAGIRLRITSHNKHTSLKGVSFRESFASMLVQPTQDEGASSERPSEALPTLSPDPTSEIPYEPQNDSSHAQTSDVPIEHQPDQSPRPSPTTTIPDSIPETSGENLGSHSSSDKSLSGNEDQAKEIQALKAQITKLKQQAKPVIKHHKAYLKSVSLKQRFPRKSFSKKHRVHKEYVSKQGRKFTKGESSVQRDPLFDEMPKDTVDHMETENAQDEGRTREIVDEDKEIDEVSTVKEGVSTDFEKVSTDRPTISTDGSKVSTDRPIEGTEEPVKGIDELKEGRLLQDHFLTLKPLQRLIQKTKVEEIEEVECSESESDGIPQVRRSFKQLESDESWLGKVQEEWEAEEERNRIAEEKAC